MEIELVSDTRITYSIEAITPPTNPADALGASSHSVKVRKDDQDVQPFRVTAT